MPIVLGTVFGLKTKLWQRVKKNQMMTNLKEKEKKINLFKAVEKRIQTTTI